MRRFRYAAACGAVIALAVLPLPVPAAVHLWDINEIFTNHDGTIQFIEMKAPVGENGQTVITGQTLRATSTVGGVVQLQVIFTFPGPNLVAPTGNKHLLI